MQNKNVHRITNLSLITMILGLKAYMKKNDRNDLNKIYRTLLYIVTVSQVILITSDVEDLLAFKEFN